VDDPALLDLWQLYLQQEATNHEAVLVAQPLEPSHHRHRWLRVKEQLRYLAQEHHQQQQHTRRTAAQNYQRAAEAARHYMLRVAADPEAVPETLQAAATLWIAAASQPIPGAATSAESLLDAGSLLDHLYGGTFFFHNHPQQEREQSAITQLVVPQAGGAPQVLDLSNLTHILPALQAFEQHYSADAPAGIYRERPVDLLQRQRMLTTMSSRLTAEAAACEGPNEDGFLTLGCLQRALSSMQRNKAPGQDGLPVELYVQQAMWPLLAPLMLAAFNEAFAAVQEQAPLAEFLLGVCWGLCWGLPGAKAAREEGVCKQPYKL
jgi:hypothetical protein